MRLAPPFWRQFVGQPAVLAAAPTAIEPVILVHGTFANAAGDGAVDWWRPGSEYVQHLDAALQAAGSRARCWAHRVAPVARPFAWSGANTERARRDAGRALAHEMSELEANLRVARYHLVAHSHGGNVVANALRELASPPAKLGAVVYMGTPYLRFHHSEPIDVRWVSIPLYLVALAGCLWAYSQATGDARQPWGLGAAVLLLAALADLLFSRRRRMRRDGDLYGSGSAHAFVFAGDEAINGLLKAQDIARHPLKFVRQLAGTGPAKPLAVPVTEPPPGQFSDELANSGVAAVLDLLDATPAATGYSVVPGLPGAPTSADRSGAGAGRRIPPMWRSVFSSLETAAAGFPVKSILQVSLWVCLLAPRLALAALIGTWTLMRGSFWFAVEKIFMVLSIALAAWALPRLIRQGAFGADQGRFVGVSNLPPGVLRHESLSGELTTAAAAVARRLGGLAGVSVLEAFGAQDAFSIKAYVEKALSDAELTHSYYYRAPEIVIATASLVAKGPPPRAMPPGLGGSFGSQWDRLGEALRERR
jgi:hypothetical protein